jgi:16S rRNA (guanine527-N7)-methyltransferase
MTQILEPFGIDLNPGLFASIRTYIALLQQWNQKISLTRIQNQDEILRLHFGESFAATPLFPMRNGRLADIGSGAGFPGIPIKMLIPGLRLTLIESNVKKATFLSEVARRLNLEPVEVINGRMEDIADDTTAFDFLTARAVGDHERLLMWARRHLAAQGKVILFVGEKDASEISKDGGWSWATNFIPMSRNRVLLSGSPR